MSSVLIPRCLAELAYGLRLPFGYWEAKDERDDLYAGIELKFKRSCPQDNIVFEDSREAVLIQNRREVIRCAVGDVEKLRYGPTQRNECANRHLRRFSEPSPKREGKAHSPLADAIPARGRALRLICVLVTMPARPTACTDRPCLS